MRKPQKVAGVWCGFKKKVNLHFVIQGIITQTKLKLPLPFLTEAVLIVLSKYLLAEKIDKIVF